jgi:hypothetical protein
MVFIAGDDADHYDEGHCGCGDGSAGCKCGSLYPNAINLALQSARAKAAYMPNCPTCATKKGMVVIGCNDMNPDSTWDSSAPSGKARQNRV